jgi:FAD/FMN-containing dehydrogenase
MTNSTTDIYRKLRKILKEENISESDIDKYTYSGTVIPPYRVIGEPGPGVPPDFVVWPEDTKQVIEIIKLANEEAIPIIPWGGEVGLRGGSIPVKSHSIVIDTKKLNKLVEINTDAMMVKARILVSL